jgi:hypothetical protein
MKQQSLKYLLFGLVALIWGLIIYKVIKNIGGNDDKLTTLPSKKKVDYTAPADSFTLLADYPDPFLPATEVTDSIDINEPIDQSSNVADISNINTQPPVSVFDPSVIEYRGIIINPEKRTKIAILTIAGKEYLAREKETIGDYLLKKIEKEKLTIVYKRSNYTIHKTNIVQ